MQAKSRNSLAILLTGRSVAIFRHLNAYSVLAKLCSILMNGAG
jgi:hypothetical protein